MHYTHTIIEKIEDRSDWVVLCYSESKLMKTVIFATQEAAEDYADRLLHIDDFKSVFPQYQAE